MTRTAFWDTVFVLFWVFIFLNFLAAVTSSVKFVMLMLEI